MADNAVACSTTEHHLRELLRKTTPLLNGTDLAEASEFLAVGEFGLALETIAGALLDREAPVPPSVVTRIRSLAKSMRLMERPFVSDPRMRVSR